jgi:3-phenylpropionate/trans-cinnamate dioxygenase ferredoxin reductase subunit
VDVRLNTTVQRLEGDGRVQRAVLSDGATLEVDLVVIGIGVVPNVELAAEAGLQVDNSIVVDELTRTSDPDIFAAGDCTNHPTALGRRIRLESWENAQNQGIACAKAMLDKGAPYHEIPWFWSDQGDMNLQLVGLPALDATGVRRGDEASGQFIVFYMKDGKIDGAAAVNNGRDVRIVRRLMQAGKIIDPARLTDPAVKLQDLLKG